MSFDTRRNRIILATLLAIAFALITVDLRDDQRSPVSDMRRFGAVVFGPVERAAAAVVNPVRDVIGDIAALPGNRRRVEELERENEELRRQLRTSELARSRAAELDKLLRVASLGQYRIVPAQVIALGPAQGFSWTVTIDAGEIDGIKPDMTVINGEGLVGRVTTVGPTTSTVLLAIDPTSSVGARLASTLEIGMVSGAGYDPMRLELLNSQAGLKKGDRLVTFGSRGAKPFVPGLPIGEVVSVEQTPGQLTRKARVRPYVNFAALDLVGVVVQPPRTDPRDALLPPKPTPQPTPRLTRQPTPQPTAQFASPSPNPRES